MEKAEIRKSGYQVVVIRISGNQESASVCVNPSTLLRTGSAVSEIEKTKPMLKWVK